MRSYTFLLAAAAAAVVAAPAAAAQAEEAASVIVNTADLDLTSERDVTRLDRRIRNAAAQVCGNAGNRSIAANDLVGRCRGAAIEGVGGEVRTLIAAASQPGVQMASQVSVRRK